MKIIFLLCLMTILSCNSGLSTKDRDYIQTMIDMHNTIARGKYHEYLINAETEARIQYIGYKLEDSLVKLTMKSAPGKYFRPYDLKKDTSVTMESYLSYCKAMGYDPKEYASRIDNK